SGSGAATVGLLGRCEMSYVIATPEMMATAAFDLARIWFAGERG
ncbi:LOW QUALITY PROTEIN: PE-PGRS family protein, partial [Mycobacterium tuberculosis T46]